MNRRISRRSLLWGLGAGASVLAIAGCSSSQPTAPSPTAKPQATGFDWKSCQGQEMRFIGLKSNIEDYWQGTVPEFESLTGIKVKFESYEQAQSRQKIATELTAGTGTLDTFRTTRSQDFAQFWENGWYEVLDPYIADPQKTTPDLDLPDFFEGAMNACKIEGKTVALPVTSAGQMLFVRKDLLEAKGLQAPKNFDELEKVAAALHNPPDVYGFVSRGQKSAAVSMFAAYLHNFGADWMGEDGKSPSLNTPEAVEAYRYYGNLLKSYGPPGITNMTHVELHPFFTQGKAALYTDDVSARTQFEDASKSTIAGKIMYAHFPAGPKRDTPTIYVYGMAVSSQSQHKDASWLWVQFVG
ncbi:MAG: ABC transporter substrate-binding protein, partial [Chloroflexota bacterium]